MTRAIVTVAADNADVWRSDAGLAIASPDGPIVVLTGFDGDVMTGCDTDTLHRLLNRCHEALLAVPGEPAWTKPWRELVDEVEELAGRLRA